MVPQVRDDPGSNPGTDTQLVNFLNFPDTAQSHTLYQQGSSCSYAMRSPIASLGITFLGTASARPSSTRNHSSLALRLDRDIWLFDCGEATQHRAFKSNLVKIGKIEKIFITHLHGERGNCGEPINLNNSWSFQAITSVGCYVCLRAL